VRTFVSLAAVAAAVGSALITRPAGTHTKAGAALAEELMQQGAERQRA
jgi:hypothetical protein